MKFEKDVIFKRLNRESMFILFHMIFVKNVYTLKCAVCTCVLPSTQVRTNIFIRSVASKPSLECKIECENGNDNL